MIYTRDRTVMVGSGGDIPTVPTVNSARESNTRGRHHSPNPGRSAKVLGKALREPAIWDGVAVKRDHACLPRGCFALVMRRVTQDAAAPLPRPSAVCTPSVLLSLNSGHRPTRRLGGMFTNRVLTAVELSASELAMMAAQPHFALRAPADGEDVAVAHWPIGAHRSDMIATAAVACSCDWPQHRFVLSADDGGDVREPRTGRIRKHRDHRHTLGVNLIDLGPAVHERAADKMRADGFRRRRSTLWAQYAVSSGHVTSTHPA